MFENACHACLPNFTVQITQNYVESSIGQKLKVVAASVSFLESQELRYLDSYYVRYSPNTETRWAGLGLHVSHVVPQI